MKHQVESFLYELFVNLLKNKKNIKENFNIDPLLCVMYRHRTTSFRQGMLPEIGSTRWKILWMQLIPGCHSEESCKESAGFGNFNLIVDPTRFLQKGIKFELSLYLVPLQIRAWDGKNCGSSTSS